MERMSKPTITFTTHELPFGTLCANHPILLNACRSRRRSIWPIDVTEGEL